MAPRKDPAYSNGKLRFNVRNMVLVDGLLKDDGISFLHAPGECLAAGERHAAKSAAPDMLAVDGLSMQVIAVRSAVSGYASGEMGCLYVGGDGMLHEFRCQPSDAVRSASAAGVALRLSRPLGEGTARSISYIRDAIRVPDVIGGVPVRTDMLQGVLRILGHRRSLDPGMRLDETEACLYMGNAISRYGMTVMDYVHAAYAVRLLNWATDTKWLGHVPGLPDDYARLYGAMFPDRASDAWRNERLEQDSSLPFGKIDPLAYRVLTKINGPEFERATGNTRPGTFDFVRVRFGIRTLSSCPDRRGMITRYRRELVKIALTKISQTKRFAAAGIPISFLAPTEMTIARCDELEILFELREI